jgi:hypothetical protein
MRLEYQEVPVLAIEQVKVGSRLRLASDGHALPSKLSLQSSCLRVLLLSGLRNLNHEINLTATFGNNTQLVYSLPRNCRFASLFAPPLLLQPTATIGRIACCV